MNESTHKSAESSSLTSLQSVVDAIQHATLAVRKSYARLTSTSHVSINEPTYIVEALSTVSHLAIESSYLLAPWLFRRRTRLELRQLRSEAEFALKQLLVSSNQTSPELQATLVRLHIAATQLQSTTHKISEFRAWVSPSALSKYFWILVAVGIVYSWCFLSGFESVSRTVVFPPGPHEIPIESNVMSSRPLNRAALLKAFSEFYFKKNIHPYNTNPSFNAYTAATFRRQPNSSLPAIAAGSPLQKQSDQSGPSRYLQHWRTELRNRSFYSSAFLSTVTLECELVRAEEFPWGELHSIPDIRFRLLAREQRTPVWARIIADSRFVPESEVLPSVELVNHGIGPAVDVVCTLTADSGLEIMKRTFQVIHEGNPIIPFCAYSIGGLQEAASRRVEMAVSLKKDAFDIVDKEHTAKLKLEYEVMNPLDAMGTQAIWPALYHRLPESVKTSSPTIVVDGSRYEVVSTVDQLRAITTVAHNETATLELTYASLTGQQFRKTTSFDLSQWLVYYSPKEDLLWYDPRLGKPQIYEREKGAEGASAILPLLLPPQVETVGKNLVRIGFTMNLWERDLGTKTEQRVAVDHFLKPQGRLVIDLYALGPRSGRYRVTVWVGDVQVDTFEIDVMSPEQFQFNEKAEEVERLRMNMQR